MDANRFDALSRWLTDARSRRGALAALLGGTLGLLGLTEATAKKHKKHKKRHGGSPPVSPPPAPPLPPSPPAAPTCSDGINNGNETGVDCGGPDCPRCANGQGCASRDDCRSAMCNLQIATCQDCTVNGDCGEDCSCYPSTQGAKICGPRTMPAPVTSCTLCPAPNFCWQPQPSEIFCVQRCGA